jgi:hypothetical protein
MSTFRTIRLAKTLALSIVALGIAQAGTITVPEGTISVTTLVTPIGGLFQYNYTVADGTGLLAVLDIPVTPGISITNLSAPGGSNAFTSAVDTVNSPGGLQEFVSFIENNGTFTSAPLSGFTFTTTVAPNSAFFNVTLFDATTATGSVQAPLATPEPTSLALYILGASAMLFRRKRLLALHPPR